MEGVKMCEEIPDLTIIELLTIPEISLKAKALASMIFYHPEIFNDPKTNKEDWISKMSKEGPTAIQTGIKELQNYDFLRKKIIRDPNIKHRVIGSIWTLYIDWPDEWVEEES
jgi:hypothetical protein